MAPRGQVSQPSLRQRQSGSGSRALTRGQCTAPSRGRRSSTAFPSTTPRRSAPIARDNEIEFGHVEGDPVPRRVFISGTEVTDAIRTSEIDRAVGPVAAVPAVREALVAQQQRIGRAGDYVVEGRDIGTVVFPEAPVKVFLTASAEERATRRVKQNEERHVGSTNYEEVLADIRKRDEIDSSRAASPLKPAEDAVHLDSTGKTIEEIISFICSRAEQAQG